MKTVTDFETVMAELQARGIVVTEARNCNLAACEAKRELFYVQWKPKMAVWMTFKENEMGGFHDIVQKVIENGNTPKAIRDGQ